MTGWLRLLGLLCLALTAACRSLAPGLAAEPELVRQLQGTAGERQVDGARVALAHTIGRGANASAVILSR